MNYELFMKRGWGQKVYSPKMSHFRMAMKIYNYYILFSNTKDNGLAYKNMKNS